MAAVCGGPLIGVASRLWNSLPAGWVMVLAATTLTAMGTSMLTRARRRRADREYERRTMLPRPGRTDDI